MWTDVRNGDANIYFAYRPAGGNWGANQRVNTDPGTANQVEPAIGVDAAGSISIAWTDDRNVDLDIYATRGTAAGGRNTATRVNADTGNGEQRQPQMAVDGPGNVHLAWFDYRSGFRDVYVAQRSAAGPWSANELWVSHDLGPGETYFVGEIALGVNSGGVLWFGHSGTVCWDTASAPTHCGYKLAIGAWSMCW